MHFRGSVAGDGGAGAFRQDGGVERISSGERRVDVLVL
jgi:hypothetical protein